MNTRKIPQKTQVTHRHDFSKLEGLKPPVDLDAIEERVFDRMVRTRYPEIADKILGKDPEVDKS